MGFIKIFIGLIFFAAICKGREQSCWGRGEIPVRRNITSRAACMDEPKEAIKQIPVPDGYDWVYPEAIVLRDCSGYSCKRNDVECVATMTKTINVKVQAYSHDMSKISCTFVEMIEHEMCGCRCEKTQEDCNPNEVFLKKRCRCECKPKLHEECKKRMLEKPGLFMWEPKSCSCPCNKPKQCGSGEAWVSEYCRCMQIMSNEIE